MFDGWMPWKWIVCGCELALGKSTREHVVLGGADARARAPCRCTSRPGTKTPLATSISRSRRRARTRGRDPAGAAAPAAGSSSASRSFGPPGRGHGSPIHGGMPHVRVVSPEVGRRASSLRPAGAARPANGAAATTGAAPTINWRLLNPRDLDMAETTSFDRYGFARGACRDGAGGDRLPGSGTCCRARRRRCAPPRRRSPATGTGCGGSGRSSARRSSRPSRTSIPATSPRTSRPGPSSATCFCGSSLRRT